jgi:hypothetical protein
MIIAACGAKNSSVDFGKTTVSDLIVLKGEPLEEKKIPVKDSKILVFPNNETFQVKNDTVTHGFKDPRGDEKSLIYWKHKFRKCEALTTKISEVKRHELPEYELKCPEQGKTVVYTEGSDFISRVIQHEKK